ncbi:MAG: alkaline phosphatase, partial [Elusimicrobiota bacterium]|nr:alkaline phosphatase [Elusimicrobiota bacterium]
MSKKVRIQALLLCVIMLCAAGYGAAQTPKVSKAKNVIYYIGDGMGPQAMGLLMQYARLAPNSIYSDRTSSLEKLIDQSQLGIMLNNSKSSIVIDSAGSGTQMSTGAYTLPARIGVDFNGQSVPNVLEMAKAAGKATALVTTSYLQDATPSAFGAHQQSRTLRQEISRDLLNNNIDIMLGSGSKYLNAPSLLDLAEKQGYSLVYNKLQMDGASGKLLGLFGDEGTPYAIENNKEMPNL